jgi:hypothetical protein
VWPQATIFHSAVLHVESQSVSVYAVQLVTVLYNLQKKCVERLENYFVPQVMRNRIKQTVGKESILIRYYLIFLQKLHRLFKYVGLAFS